LGGIGSVGWVLGETDSLCGRVYFDEGELREERMNEQVVIIGN
jgi:hypothetical protein